MNREFEVELTVRRRIDAELVRIETEYQVRVVLAIESGSRAWGFPSTDSDYDVRFIYVGSVDTYLSLGPRRDVIEQPLSGDLDIGGWDLRKALQLALRSNAVLVEWLSSPVRYRDEVGLTGRLREIVSAAVHLPALEYHYDRSARRALIGIDGTAAPRLKAYCYALRPALALRWLRSHRTPPPMDLPSLMSGLDVPEPVAQAIGELVRRKAGAREDAKIPRVAILDGYLRDTLTLEVPRPREPSGPPGAADQAQWFFASVVLHGLIAEP